MRYGHIKLSRKIVDGDDFLWESREPFDRRSAWIDLLFLTAYKAGPYTTASGSDDLLRGEFVASLRFLGKRWRWDKMRVSRFLSALEKARRITRQREGEHGMIYLVAKYDAYQTGNADTSDEGETPRESKTRQSRDNDETKEKAVKQSSKKDSFPNAVYEWLQREWFARFGVVAPMQFRVGIKALLVQGVRPGQLARAFAAYREDRNHAKKDGTFAWFLGDVQRHIAEGDLCSIQLMPPDAFGLTQAEANVKIAAHQERLKQQDDALYQRILTGQVAA